MPAGRKASRNFHVVDHAEQGLEGMVSIFGGKLTTYRLMAERVSDNVCARIGVHAPVARRMKRWCPIPIKPCAPRGPLFPHAGAHHHGGPARRRSARRAATG